MSSLEVKISQYRPLDTELEDLKGLKVVFLVGITGAGKNTIADKLFATDKYAEVVSHTSRSPRENEGIMEVDGEHYHFVDLAKIEDMVDHQEFFELKINHGKVYGTSIMALKKVRDSGKIALGDIDYKGIVEYMELVPDYVTPIFVLPPDFETWQKRFSSRYDDGVVPEDEYVVRLKTAKDELEAVLDEDYYEFVINDDLEHAVKVVDDIAHGRISSKKNEQAKAVAKKLLDDLNMHLAQI